jgi:hypothetical protein
MAIRKLPIVKILVQDPGKCPVLETGGVMMYAHPEVLREQSGRTCAQALAVLAPAAEEIACAAAEGRPMEPLILSCPVEDCGAVFVLKALSRAEAAALAARKQRSRGRPAERGAARARGGPLKWAMIVLLVVTLLAAGGSAAVVFLAPDILPPEVTTRLRAWGVPVPEAPAEDASGGTRNGRETGAAR